MAAEADRRWTGPFFFVQVLARALVPLRAPHTVYSLRQMADCQLGFLTENDSFDAEVRTAPSGPTVDAARAAGDARARCDRHQRHGAAAQLCGRVRRPGARVPGKPRQTRPSGVTRAPVLGRCGATSHRPRHAPRAHRWRRSRRPHSALIHACRWYERRHGCAVKSVRTRTARALRRCACAATTTSAAHRRAPPSSSTAPTSGQISSRSGAAPPRPPLPWAAASLTTGFRSGGVKCVVLNSQLYKDGSACAGCRCAPELRGEKPNVAPSQTLPPSRTPGSGASCSAALLPCTRW
jgi:hypothetical protein